MLDIRKYDISNHQSVCQRYQFYMISSDWKGCIILTILYIQQGLLIGFIFSLVIILTERGVPFQKVSLLIFSASPFSLKFIWSPFMDYYYHAGIGKRKTYIFPCLLLSILGYTYLFFRFDAIIEREEYFKFSLIFFVIILGTVTQDTAVDGWQQTLLSEENIGLGSVCQDFGLSVGTFLAEYAFLLVSSKEFCKRYFSLDSPLLEISDYFRIQIMYCSILIVIVAFVHETNPVEVMKISKISDQILLFKNFYQNEHFKLLCSVLLLKRVGLGMIETIAKIYLISIGVTRIFISNVSIASFLISMWFPLMVGKFITGRKLENKITMGIVVLQTWNMIFFSFALYGYQYHHHSLTLICISLFLAEYKIDQ